MELNQWSVGEVKKQVVKTEGYWIEYSNGEKHIDIQCGNAAYILGYGDEEVINSIREGQVNFLRGNSGETSYCNEKFIKIICEKGNWAGLGYAVSGSDAVESAIAMNDTYWSYKGYDKRKILSFVPGYHGTTMLGKHLRGEYPYLGRACMVNGPVWKKVENQLQAESIALKNVRQKLETDKNIGCLIMETVPWIENVTPYSTNWWKSIRNICDEFDILMVLDDVAFCWGKNGAFFGWEPYGVKPDISALGKSLTGGYSPLGISTCVKKVYDVISKKSWDHGHTWSPNMSGIYASLKVTEKIEKLLYKSTYINDELQKIADEFGLNSRGSNLFRCFDTPKEISLSALSEAKLVAAIPSYDRNLKIVAPLIADEEYFFELKKRMKLLF